MSEISNYVNRDCKRISSMRQATSNYTFVYTVSTVCRGPVTRTAAGEWRPSSKSQSDILYATGGRIGHANAPESLRTFSIVNPTEIFREHRSFTRLGIIRESCWCLMCSIPHRFTYYSNTHINIGLCNRIMIQ